MVFFADIDAARTAEDSRQCAVFPPSGQAVRYYRCMRCGFISTTHFDHLTDEQMSSDIYNVDYIRADPEFAEARPRYFTELLATTLAPLRESLSCLDFGGGAGTLSKFMREQGFTYESFDPYFPAAEPKSGPYDLVTAFEVVEHSRAPIATFHAALAKLRPEGLLIFSTLLQPRPVTSEWWYIAPRNGHVSVHTRDSLAHVARICGVHHLAIGGGLHVFYRRKSPMLECLLRRYTNAAIYAASQEGILTFFDSAVALARAGHWRPAVDPKSWARALMRSLQLAQRPPASPSDSK